MVKNYVRLIVALVFTTNLMAQNVPNYVPTNGLVGWWPFNGNANDESGNGKHGTVNEAILSKDRFGKENNSYLFDGVNDRISIPFNLISNTQSDYSISVWFKSNSVKLSQENNPTIITDRGTSWEYKYAIGRGVSSQKLGGGVYSQGVETSLDNTDLNWHHVVLIFEKSAQKLYLFLDGVLKASDVNITNWSNNLSNTTIGALNSPDGWGYLGHWDGNIDDISIYSRVLTPQEISKMFYAPSPCTTPSATITPQGNTTFCQGGFVNLSVSSGANYTYEWYKNGQLINGATASVYQATASGNYTVKVIDGACNATSTPTTVTVNQYPSSVVNVSGNTTFCEGNSVALTAQGNGTYLWSNGATSKSITVSQAGSYGVTITSNGCVSNSNQTTITVNPNPTATITPQGNTTFCQGGFVNLVASGGSSFQWNTGSSAATFSATQSGTYTVNVFNSFGCQATASQQVNVNPLPNVTLNALNQFTLKNASPIQLVANPTGGIFSGEGVQGATFTPANVSLGKKTITYNYTSPQGCSGVASRSTIIADTLGNVCSTYDTLKVKFKLTTGIKANQYTTMNVYPNPTSDVIIVDASDVAALNGYSYKLFDVQGKEVYNALVTNVKTEISMKTFGKAGVYILHVVDANNVSIETKQIVLE